MPAFASLTLKNNAAVDVVFTPQSQDADGVATFLSSETILDAKKKVTLSTSLPKNGSVIARIKQKIIVPVMDTVDPSKKVGEAYVNIDFVFPKIASETIRLDLRKYADTLLTNAVTTAMVQNLEGIY